MAYNHKNLMQNNPEITQGICARRKRQYFCNRDLKAQVELFLMNGASSAFSLLKDWSTAGYGNQRRYCTGRKAFGFLPE